MTKQNFSSIIFHLFVILTIIFIIKFRIVSVNGQSMYPTYDDKELHLMLNTNQINDGDIVIIDVKDTQLPADYIIKRFYEDKSTDNLIWVEGDNKENSLDSRSFGKLKRERIMGKILF